MKNIVFYLTVVCILLGTSTINAQQASESPETEVSPLKSPDNFGWDSRLGFVIGLGASHILKDIYQDVSINRTNNAVIIERADRLRSSVTLGIVFSPWAITTERKIKVNNNGKTETITDYQYYPRGFTFAVLANPLNLTAASNTTFAPTDLGVGIGYRSGDFTGLLTLEFTSVRQPKQYFIEAYKGNDLQFVIDEQIQNAIDINDNSIYKNVVIPAIGFKLAYTFKIFSSFKSVTKDGG